MNLKPGKLLSIKYNITLVSFIVQLLKFKIVYYMANWSTMKRSILIGSLSGPNFTIGPLRWTTHELISSKSFYETLNKEKCFPLSRNILPYVWQTILVILSAKWSEKCKNMLKFVGMH